MRFVKVIQKQLAMLMLSLATIVPALAQVKPAIKAIDAAPPASVIYIGNSFFYYNNGIHSMVGNMASEGVKGHKLRSSLVTIGGSGRTTSPATSVVSLLDLTVRLALSQLRPALTARVLSLRGKSCASGRGMIGYQTT